jgi:TldD protein
MPQVIDESFLALPRARLADAALTRARTLGAQHAEFRLEQVRRSRIAVHDGDLEGAIDGEDTGFAVRVVYEGTWGFAAGVDLTPDAAARVAELAIDMARTSRPISSEEVELADEPVYADVTWASSYEVNPFDVAEADRIGLLTGWTRTLLAADGVDHADAVVRTAQENKYYADLAGTATTQQRVRIDPDVTAVSIDPS